MGKLVIALLVGMIPLAASAEIYKCKDARQRIVYQDEPCAAKQKQLGTVEEMPPVSAEDEQRAREQLKRLQEENRYQDQKRLAQEKIHAEEARQLAAVEEARQRELAAAEAERALSSAYVPVYGSGYARRSRNNNASTGVTIRPSQPCVIGYVGDRSCQQAMPPNSAPPGKPGKPSGGNSSKPSHR
ncbi:MAG: DUF4124 domain-containing protein [Methylobacillus sp.]|jgi:multidrug efflux pump subunit AcrA (membrane-fusion protein)|nr:DUF4124 domain-containing protein [Methylobacillus sp.]